MAGIVELKAFVVWIKKVNGNKISIFLKFFTLCVSILNVCNYK